jgi:hypothetical protein
VIDDWHLIHLAVAARATDAAIHMRGVIVINVIGRAMELHPLDWLPGFPARPHRFKLRIVLFHLLVTRHAGLRVRQIRVRRDIDEIVAVTAIHPELLDMHIVREWHRLNRLVSDAGILRRDVIPGPGGQPANDHHATDRDF